ncbi:Cof-type HAD-IIB family hydrolase [Paludibacterium paludis]|uniref:Cof subfamily protein (Haloacid dehalogenase superfamily)/HAD superfamily hydrolase (TIGR01484 family) n=1 Tax=Paludibacterium paludis TaxID=1225769 RepID=A0A918P743_9NEIS|nr:Cof-type HAD-IIB family hydrolase [Paludibacterium paludis]GGY28314.1 hypothetical protein GCM10011289_34440 [Paludibacterium paludis]
MYRFIASDLDGTLLDKAHRVHEHTARTLREIAGLGVRFALATGRHYLDVRGIRQSLGIDAHLITANGARVHDPDDRLIFQADLPPDAVRAIAAPGVATPDCLTNFYLDEGWLIDRPAPQLLHVHKDSGMTYRVADLSTHSGLGVYKVLYIGRHDELLEVERRLHERLGDGAYITFSADDCLEVMARGVSKGHALQLVLDRLGIDAKACLAFGDGQNDIELLRAAGHPRLMGNAHRRLVEELPDLPQIGHHHPHGLANHLRELFRLSE